MDIAKSGPGFPSISASDLNAVQNASDRNHIGSLASRIWDKVADWFCNTNRTEAKQVLFDLYSPATSDHQKIEAFDRLRDMASGGYQDRFKSERGETGQDERYVIELGLDGIEDFSLWRRQIDCDQAKIGEIFNAELAKDLKQIEDKTVSAASTTNRFQVEIDIGRSAYSIAGESLTDPSKLDEALAKLGCSPQEKVAITVLCHQGWFAVVALQGTNDHLLCMGHQETSYNITRENGTIRIQAHNYQDTALVDARDRLFEEIRNTPEQYKSVELSAEFSVAHDGTISVDNVSYLANKGLGLADLGNDAGGDFHWIQDPL